MPRIASISKYWVLRVEGAFALGLVEGGHPDTLDQRLRHAVQGVAARSPTASRIVGTMSMT